MAGIPCSNEDGNQAVLIATDLSSGDAFSPCGPCLPGYALSFAAAMTQNMAPETAEAYGALFDQISANDTRPKADAAAPRKAQHARSRKQESAQSGAQDEQSNYTGTTAPESASPTGKTQQDEPQSDGLTDAERGAFDMAPGF